MYKRQVYGALNGIQGIMDRRIIRLDSQMHSEGDFQLLESTPAMALGLSLIHIYYSTLLGTF